MGCQMLHQIVKTEVKTQFTYFNLHKKKESRERRRFKILLQVVRPYSIRNQIYPYGMSYDILQNRI